MRYKRLIGARYREAFLYSSLFMEFYKRLDVLLTFDGGEWTVFMPEHIFERMLDEGKRFYDDEHDFQKWYDEFIRYLRSADEMIITNLTKRKTRRFFHLFTRFFYHYSKTEYFYVDKAAAIVSENLKRMMEIKTTARKLLNKMAFERGNFLEVLIKSLSTEFSIPVDDLYNYAYWEIIDLFDGKKVDPELIERRKARFAFDGKDVTYRRMSMPDEGDGMKGMCANPGKAKGKVVIIPPEVSAHFSAELDMDKGDILVAEMTGPELSVLFDKAGAIVTNQGGLLSHAAIVAREKKIPCIVGTGRATSALKDGDLVEVDADKGLVKICN